MTQIKFSRNNVVSDILVLWYYGILNAALISRSSSLSFEQLSRKEETTNRVYQEILKNKERVEFMLSSETPEFQVIDRTFIPIVAASSKLKALLIGGFLGGFLGVGYIIGRKVIRDAMA